MDNKYNGWTNYATWRINLEIFDNSQLDEFDESVLAYDMQELEENKDDILSNVSDMLKEYVNDLLFEQSNKGDSGDNLVLDYAMAFINDVNWYEIAESMYTDYIDNLKED